MSTMRVVVDGNEALREVVSIERLEDQMSRRVPRIADDELVVYVLGSDIPHIFKTFSSSAQPRARHEKPR